MSKTIEELRAKRRADNERRAAVAAYELEGQIVRYRSWSLVNRKCCGHPGGALLIDGEQRLCRVCGHRFLQVHQTAESSP